MGAFRFGTPGSGDASVAAPVATARNQRGLWMVLACASALAVVVGLLHAQALHRVEESVDSVEQTQELRLAAARLADDLRVVGTAADTLADTASVPATAAFDDALREAGQSLDALGRHAAAAPDRRQRFDALADSVRRYQDGVRKSLAAGSTGLQADPGAQTSARQQRRIALEQAIAQIEAIDREAFIALETLKSQRIGDRDRTVNTLVVAALLATVPLLVALWYALASGSQRRVAEAERRYQHLFELNPLPMMIFDVETHRFLEVNRAAVDHYGYSRERFLQMTLFDLRPPEDAPRLRRTLAAGDGNYGPADWRHVTAGGTQIVVRIFASAVRFAGRRARIVLAEDVTEARRNEVLLRARERQLGEISRRLLDAQEDERRAIARELHDDLLQDLAAARICVQAAGASSDAPRRGERIAEANRILGELVPRLRSRALDLHPGVLDELGLAPAIDWLCERTQGASGLPVLRSGALKLAPLDPSVELSAFRIVQEALTNAVRHSGAQSIEVTLARDGEHLTVEVRDDGVGIAGGESDASARRSLGMVSMRERAELVGGRLSVESPPGGGTRVRLALPWAERAIA